MKEMTSVQRTLFRHLRSLPDFDTKRTCYLLIRSARSSRHSSASRFANSNSAAVKGVHDGDEFIEVPEEEIIRGYEHAKGQHVLIGPKELGDLKLEAKHTIDLAKIGSDPEALPTPTFPIGVASGVPPVKVVGTDSRRSRLKGLNAETPSMSRGWCNAFTPDALKGMRSSTRKFGTRS